jgi:hypothetical protein
LPAFIIVDLAGLAADRHRGIFIRRMPVVLHRPEKRIQSDRGERVTGEAV